MSADDVAVFRAAVALAGLGVVAFLWDDGSPDSSSSSAAAYAPATATVTAPITNTITITNPAPSAPVMTSGIGTGSLTLILAVVLAVGLAALIGWVGAAYLFGAQGGRRGLRRGGEYSYSPLAHEPTRGRHW